METPQTAGELSQFVNCCRWISLAIPNFPSRVAPLTDTPEEAHKISGKRTSKCIKNISLLSLAWGAAHEEAFRDLQETLRKAVQFSYPDPEQEICVFTDASERFWSVVVTQCSPEERDKLPPDQRHEPLAFLGSQFEKGELNWTMFEKEGFSIFQAFEKLDYLLMSGRPAHVFNDHRNLLFVFAPLALEPALGRQVVSKVQRWALFWSKYNYVTEHIDGDDNVFADILTRWTTG